MFSYNTPKWTYRISKRHLSIFFTAVFVLMLIPMLVIGFYDFPSADDFSMALETHQKFVETGSVFQACLASLKKAWLVYSQYEGYFFSIIITNICPSAFSESIYFLTPFIILGMLIFGVLYFFDALFVRVWKLDKDLTNVAAMVTLILMIQSLPKGGLRVEAFYWYSGAINYTFTFGMAFFWLGLLIRCVYDEDEKAKKRKLFWATFWGFWMGGANYLTALELAIISVLVLFIMVMTKKGIFKTEKPWKNIWIPAVVNLIGFACSCFTPGNLVRSEETQHVGAVKSILLSIYSTFDMMTNDMARWELWVALVLLLPIFWTMAAGIKHRFEHPFMFVLFSFLLVSSNMVPPFYAVGNIGAGRLKALGWMEFVVMLVLTLFYLTVWARQHIESKVVAQEDRLSVTSSLIVATCLGFLIFGAGLSIIPDHDYFSGTSALYALTDGSAVTYRRENMERLEILRDDNIRDAELPEHSVHPDLLFYWDVTYDKSEWVNTATATYYNKDTVVLIKD